MLPRAAHLAFACLLLPVLAAPVAAADGPPPLPGEPGAQVLDGLTFGAIVADLDGDGTRELVRLVTKSDSPGLLAIDGWRVDGDAWRSIGEVGLTRAASVNEILSERPARRNPQRPVGVDEPARFLIWNDGQREHLLVATIAASLEPVACCLTVWDVGESDGRLALRQLLSTQGNATSILSLDLDGDAADELFITQQPDPRGPNEVPIRIYDWNGNGFDERIGSFIAQPGWAVFPSGDTDGRPGGEVLISSDPIDGGGDAVLYRIWLDGSALATESWSVRDRGQVTSFDAGDGALIAIVPPEIGLSLILRWPAGGQIAYDAASAVHGTLAGVLGSGAGTRLLFASPAVESGLVATDRRLRPIPLPSLQGAAAPLLANGGSPYTGPLPGGIDGRPAVIARGRLIDGAPSGAALESLPSRPMAALPDETPIGLAGPDESWMVLLEGAHDISRDGGPLTESSAASGGRVSVAPTGLVFSPERDGGRLSAAFAGAAETGEPGQIATRERSFSVEIIAPRGSSILPVEGSPAMAVGRPAAAPSSAMERLSVPVEVPSDLDSGGSFYLRMVVATPAGHAYAGSWRVQVLRKPPPLATETPLAPLSLDVPVSGTTLPGSSVTVNGAPVAVLPDGSFRTTIAAGLLPIDVRVVATDAVGNVSTSIVSVVGFVDYRRLPWIPFVALLTVAAAVILFLKVPRPRLEPARAPDDDGRLEEIDQG
ncbi:MAG TPA: hypothetical protein VFX74_01490 [Candidatus Limnocylindria bacterium]|nr:hypothetical protein [Candidatus Limnocylindria bacterium]